MPTETTGVIAPPDDIMIRLGQDDAGNRTHEVLILLNNEENLPEMQRLADYLNRCLEIFGRSDTRIEYHDAFKAIEEFRPRIKLVS